MRTIQISITLFEKGDRVFTPQGWATVVRNEEVPDCISERMVLIKLDEATSSHPHAKPFRYRASLCTPAVKCSEPDPKAAT
jgi:hypothetical protein